MFQRVLNGVINGIYTYIYYIHVMCTVQRYPTSHMRDNYLYFSPKRPTVDTGRAVVCSIVVPNVVLSELVSNNDFSTVVCVVYVCMCATHVQSHITSVVSSFNLLFHSFTGMIRDGVKIPQDGNRSNKYKHVAVVHGHVWRTLCSVCATGARVARPVPCNS